MNETYSQIRLKEISTRVKDIPELKENSLCIYTTGSYGRLEASENSDLDLFFLDSDSQKITSNIDKTLINADVIKICRSMKLPEFSKDGGYLTIHNIDDIKNELGSPNDDYYNYFTARMLLLLESKPIYNEELHISCLNQVINPYYVDFHDHSQSFKPIFLTNDIIRFWKTLCLNYEHRRKRKASEEENGNKNVTHSKNLKLQFSRKLTCFSFILQLANFKGTIIEKDILDIALLTPIERINKLKAENKDIDSLIQKIIDSYNWFLERTQIPSQEMLNWISDKNLRNEAFNKSGEFGDNLLELLQAIDNQNILKKLLI
jgi:hypothetical protein